MAALKAGSKAPDFQLSEMSGRQFRLSNALSDGPVVLAFFKISCPVCQFALPYVERIYQAAQATNGRKVTIVGISQNSKKDTEFFNRQYGIKMPVALDDPNGYAVSNAYGLTNVPSIFYIGQNGTIEISSVGWSKDDVLEIARRVSEQAAISDIPVIRPGDEVPAFRGG
jgi:peroxiredoxin